MQMVLICLWLNGHESNRENDKTTWQLIFPRISRILTDYTENMAVFYQIPQSPRRWIPDDSSLILKPFNPGNLPAVFQISVSQASSLRSVVVAIFLSRMNPVFSHAATQHPQESNHGKNLRAFVASCESHRIRESGAAGFPTLQDL